MRLFAPKEASRALWLAWVTLITTEDRPRKNRATVTSSHHPILAPQVLLTARPIAIGVAVDVAHHMPPSEPSPREIAKSTLSQYCG